MPLKVGADFIVNRDPFMDAKQVLLRISRELLRLGHRRRGPH
jgi:hypothetical protein